MYAFKLCMVRENEVNYPDVVFHNSQEVASLVNKYIGTPDREVCVILALKVGMEIIGINTLSIGALDFANVHPREVFKFAILANASSIILVHNHPSGNTHASENDIALTKRLKEAGDLMLIKLLDHVIVGHDGRYTSMAAEGYLGTTN